MSATCRECGATAPLCEGYCEECLDRFEDNVSAPEKPANTLDELIALRDAAHDRLEKLGGFDEYGGDKSDVRALKDSDLTVPVERHLAVLAKMAARREHDTLAWLCEQATEAWALWRRWEIVQRWCKQGSLFRGRAEAE